MFFSIFGLDYNQMKRTILAFTLICFICGTADAQSWQDMLNKTKGQLGQGSGSGSGGGSVKDLTNTEIVNGLKEALRVGANNASGKLSATNGFFGNALIKVLMPPEARQ